jgi:hypothetical protein
LMRLAKFGMLSYPSMRDHVYAMSSGSMLPKNALGDTSLTLTGRYNTKLHETPNRIIWLT